MVRRSPESVPCLSRSQRGHPKSGFLWPSACTQRTCLHSPGAGRCSTSAAGLSLGVLGENSELGSATSSWRLEGAVLARRFKPAEATLRLVKPFFRLVFCLLANAFLISSVLLIFFSLSWGWSVSRCFSGFLHCNDGTIT